ncbi:hypothetical protein FHL06_00595 [Lactobacillus halodurans]|uniref:Uncharacterized protein n=1 Tax=Companilactobacillus halodurans TaxID=2584183 RepID=A0A5P0ZKX5_9LACO|nr:hypothetical protein [Companilactobacillus halodurans]MQS74894.1 hypothetical protein [Companilactobacillus halodurans]
MEMGSLAEWVEGLGELLAVCVALFLPYYQACKKKQEKNQRAKQVIIGTSKTILELNNIQKSIEFDELKTFVAVYSVLTTNDATIKIMDLGNEILTIIGDENVLDDSQKSKIRNLQNEIKLIKI